MVTWLLLLWLAGDSDIEHFLFDFQQTLVRAAQGDPVVPAELVLAAVDRQAFEAGIRAKDLAEIAQAFGPQSVDVNAFDLSAYFAPDEDGVLRSVKLYLMKDGEVTLSPLLKLYLERTGVDPRAVEVSHTGLTYPGGSLATDGEGRIYPFFPVADPYTYATRGGGLWSRLFAKINPETQVTFFPLEPVSVLTLIQERVDLTGRLVLLGTYLKEAEEIEFDTPTGNMVRLELCGSVLANLLEGTYFKPAGPFWSWVVPLIFILVLSLTVPGKPTINSVGWWLVWTACWGAVCCYNYQNFRVLNQTAVLGAGLVVLLLHILSRSWRVTALLQGFGGRQPLQKSGEEMVVTILFTNLPDSIKSLEETRPEEAQAARAAHSRCVGYVVNRHQGRLVDLQGDAQMIAFGLEETGADHRKQALACALELVDKVNHLMGIPVTETGVAFCGLVTGPVAVGQVGGGRYHGVAAVGDTTNSAARLMGQAKKKNKPVLCSELTVAEVGPRAELERIGELQVKGREEPLRVWEVKRYHPQPNPPYSFHASNRGPIPKLAFLSATLLSVGLGVFLSRNLPFDRILLDTLTPSLHRAPIIFAGLTEQGVEDPPWPWPRSLHARIAQNCLDAGASAIFLDFLFEDVDDPEQDAELVKVALENREVFLAAAALHDGLGNPVSPKLLPGLLDSESWGLINQAPSNGKSKTRYALWELPINDGRLLAPGITKSMLTVLAPDKAEKMDSRGDYLIRWGPLPPRVEYHQLLNSNHPIFEKMKGAIIVAGDALPGRSDVFETPAGPLKGAVIHALSLQTLLESDLLEDNSGGLSALLLSWLLAAALLTLSWRLKAVSAQVALLAGGLSVATLLIKVLATTGSFIGALPCLVVPIVLALGWILAITDTNRAMTKYIPRKLQETLEREGTVADLTTTGTVLLTDIRGYTTLSEGRSPSEVLALLNSYHEKTARCYEKYGGHLLTYQGDAQIVVFGPLDPVDNPVLAAVNSARALPEIVGEVARDAGLEPGILRVGSGITTGRLTLSLMGAEGQLQYSVFGAPVRRAHHLQSLSDDLARSIILDHRSGLTVRNLLPLEERTSSEGERFYTVPEGKPS